MAVGQEVNRRATHGSAAAALEVWGACMGLRSHFEDSRSLPSIWLAQGRRPLSGCFIPPAIPNEGQPVIRMAAKTYAPSDDPPPAVFVTIQVERCLLQLDRAFQFCPHRSMAEWHYQDGRPLVHFHHPEVAMHKRPGSAVWIVHRNLLKVLARQIDTMELETIAQRAASEVRGRRRAS